MADFYATNHDHGGGAGAGVTNINGLTGAVTLAAGANITITPSGNTLTIASTSGGTVTSVGLSLPASVFTVTGSPVTTSGTLTGSLNTQTANTVFAGPGSGGPATPTFRALVSADIPSLSGLYANTALSNLIPTAINQSLIPDTDANYDLGSAALEWSAVYARTLNDSAGQNSVDIGNRILIDTAGNSMLDWSGPDLNANNHLIQNVIDPVAAQDAATKNYVDTSFANTALSNLIPTAINQDLVPNADAALNLGSPSFRWFAGYIHNLRNASNTILIAVNDKQLYDGAPVLSVDWGARHLVNATGITLLDWNGSNLSLGTASLLWPNTDGTSGQVLTTDGAGNLSWATNGTGTVTSVVAGTGLDVGAGPGGTITTTGTLNLAATAVTPGTYTNATLTVDAQGRLTAASSGGTGADWSLAGNALTGTEFLGSTNAFDIVFKTNNVESMVLSTTLHSLKHGVVAVGGSLLADGVGSQAHGNVDATSIIDAADTGSTAFGNSLTGGTISASGFGAQARGHATDSGVISTGGPGAEAGGSADGVGSAIQAGVVGARASGVVTTGGIIDAAGDGSRAFGGAIAGGLISAADIGTLASGFADDSGVISAGGQGGRAHGYAFNTNSSISTAATGAEASGSAIDGGVISAGGTGSMAHGSAVNADSLIDASGEGATAYGSVGSGGIITASGIGAGASGIANNLFIVEAASDAAQAHGYAFGGNISSQSGGSVAEGFADAFNITAGGAGSRATGFASLGDVGATAVGSMAHGDDLAAGATYGVVLGLGHDLDSYACTVVGVYADVTGFTAASIVETDPAFVVGTGVSGTPENGFRVDKDARITTAAGLVTKAIRAAAASGDVTVDLRTDYKIIVDTSTSDGPFNINLPAGEDGLTYKFGNTTGGGTVVYNFVPDGADLVNAGISSINSGTAAQEITFLGGTWYATS